MRLWQALEALPGPAAVLAQWQKLLGDELHLLQPYFKPWPQPAAKRLAIVSRQAEALGSRLTDPTFVRSPGGEDVTWCIGAAITCPPLNQPKHPHCSRMREELFATDWDLLLCSAGALSAILCEQAQSAGRKALDIRALDATIICHKS
ncbi:MAG: hypothetical protein K6T86_03335 [Pirellulales bacterium]|nr:hypothetical protein [Pirellulales bacterium]